MSETGGSRGPRAAVLATLGYIIYLPIAAGFFFHTSPPTGPGQAAHWRLFDKYSAPYLAFLALLFIGAIFLPWLARAMSRPTRLWPAPDEGSGSDQPAVISGWRKVRLVVTAALLTVFGVGLVIELVWRASAVGGWLRKPEDGPPAFQAFLERAPAPGGPRNSRGWLGAEMTVRKRPGICRIFALGGSTTYLVKYVEPGENFVLRLRPLLEEKRNERGFEVQNAASHENTSMHSLVKYLTVVQDFEPDFVLVMHAINDWRAASEGAAPPWRTEFEGDYSHDSERFGRLAEDGGLSRPQRPMWAASLVGRRLGEAIQRTWLSDLRRPRAIPEDAARRRVDDALARGLPVFRRNLRTLGQAVAARGGRLVILAQPTMFRPGGGVTTSAAYLRPEDLDSPLWRDRPDLLERVTTEALRRYNDAAREVAAELNTIYVDLEAAVPPRWEFFHPETGDGIHMNGAGCELAAKAIRDALLPLIAPTTPSPRTREDRR